MTSSTHDADLKGSNFIRTIHPKIFIAVAFILSELEGGASRAPPPRAEIPKIPGLDRVNKKLSEWDNFFNVICLRSNFKNSSFVFHWVFLNTRQSTKTLSLWPHVFMCFLVFRNPMKHSHLFLRCSLQK